MGQGLELTVISATIGVAIALACAYYCRSLAVEKGRNVVLWTLLGLVLTVIAVPVLVLLPVVGRGADGESPPDGDGMSGASSDLPTEPTESA